MNKDTRKDNLVAHILQVHEKNPFSHVERDISHIDTYAQLSERYFQPSI
jgi:hypothetical protein